MKRFEIFVGPMIIGHSELERGDPSMGVAGGLFVPVAGYAAVREACLAARETSQSHIGLGVRVRGGEALPAQGGLQILDYSEELGAKGLEIHVNGIPYPLYEQLFPAHDAASARQPGDEG